MKTERPTAPALALLTMGLALAACGSDPPPPPPPPPVYVPSAPAAAAQPAATTTAAAPVVAPVVALRDDEISVRFLRVTDKGFPELEMTNLTDRDIETLRGSFGAKNAEGAQVWGTGLTIAVPGQVFLAAGASRVTTPFGLDRKPEMMEILRTDPASLTFFFIAKEIGFRGE